jgi:site-specific recombinase XerD
MVLEYRAHLLAEGASENTVRAYVSDLRAFLIWGWESTSQEDWEALASHWLNAERARGVGAATLNRRATALRRWFETTRGTAPLAKYKCPPAPPGEAHPLPNLLVDVRKMIEVTDNHEVKLAIALMGFAGLRVSEARTIQWSWLRKNGDDWSIRVIGKGGKERTVPVAPELLALIDVADPTFPYEGRMIKMTDRGIRSAVTRAGEQAEIGRPVASHDLRMTFGTVVYNLTKDLRVTQELMGHSSSKTTERYTGVTEAAKIAAVQGAMA